jgi:D-alanine-D-alanine ligase
MKSRNISVGIAFNAYEPTIGRNQERVSEESVAQVAEEVCLAVASLGHSVTIIPLRQSLMGFLHRLTELELDVLINLCEGFYGKPQWEANIAALLELLPLPFTGNVSQTLGLCQDKSKAKAILSANNLPTAPSRAVNSCEDSVDLPFPLIVKPNSEDASLGIYPDSVVKDQESLCKQITRILERYEKPALVEQYIEGREFNVAVLQNERLEALPVSEIDFSRMPESYPRICSYEAKWFQDHFLYDSTPPVCPAKIDDALREKLQETAVAAFKALGCRDYARVDFRMAEDGRLSILEVNPNPDISRDAGYARALEAAKIDYKDFWKVLIENALRRKNGHDPLDGKHG